MEVHQVDCFKINMRFWKALAIWPGNNSNRYYDIYSKAFILIFVIIYLILFSINFYFLPRQLDIFIEEMIFFFTDVSVSSKVLTFLIMRNKISELLDTLESDIFQPDDAESLAIIEKAKEFNKWYWKIVAFFSITSDMTLLSPLLTHLVLRVELSMPVCSYSFLTEKFKETFKYPLYFYQGLGITLHMLYNVNIDTFFHGLMVFIIAQLDILDKKLRKVADTIKIENGIARSHNHINNVKEAVTKINQCIVHFDKVAKFCTLVEEVFTVTLFVQFSMASCIICVCLMRFTMPAPFQYFVFLATYSFMMLIQIMVPCWFGTRIMDKSNFLAFSIYNCNWTTTSREFKTNMRVFVERANRPLSISGGKLFSLSLNTFTSILNTAYSFFTLLQQVQRQ